MFTATVREYMERVLEHLADGARPSAPPDLLGRFRPLEWEDVQIALHRLKQLGLVAEVVPIRPNRLRSRRSVLITREVR